VQRDMSPVSDKARALFVPRVSPIPGEVVPVKFFLIKLAFRPFGHSADHIFLRHIIATSIWSVRRRWECVGSRNIGANSDQEYPPAVLGDAVVPCVQDLPDHAIPGKTKSVKLILQKLPVRAIRHPVHIFHHERLGPYQSQDAVKLTIKEVY